MRRSNSNPSGRSGSACSSLTAEDSNHAFLSGRDLVPAPLTFAKFDFVRLRGRKHPWCYAYVFPAEEVNGHLMEIPEVLFDGSKPLYVIWSVECVLSTSNELRERSQTADLLITDGPSTRDCCCHTVGHMADLPQLMAGRPNWRPLQSVSLTMSARRARPILQAQITPRHTHAHTHTHI